MLGVVHASTYFVSIFVTKSYNTNNMNVKLRLGNTTIVNKIEAIEFRPADDITINDEFNNEVISW
jgi:hypothetical protein